MALFKGPCQTSPDLTTIYPAVISIYIRTDIVPGRIKYQSRMTHSVPERCILPRDMQTVHMLARFNARRVKSPLNKVVRCKIGYTLYNLSHCVNIGAVRADAGTRAVGLPTISRENSQWRPRSTPLSDREHMARSWPQEQRWWRGV